jgi:hypothetical protein
MNNRSEFATIALISVGGWWLFELYNSPRFWQSDLELWWHYQHLEPNIFLRRIGYDWAFATISPAMFETADLIAGTTFNKIKPGRRFYVSGQARYAVVAIGAFCAVLPLIVISTWLVPLVWLGLILAFDPINGLRGQPSILTDLESGRYQRLLSLLTAGGICGVLWEFWNYWAITKWTYTVPYLGNVKLFEMPVLGFLGFPPFAVECWAMYVLLRGSLLGLRNWNDAEDPVFPMSARRATPNAHTELRDASREGDQPTEPAR